MKIIYRYNLQSFDWFMFLLFSLIRFTFQHRSWAIPGEICLSWEYDGCHYPTPHYWTKGEWMFHKLKISFFIIYTIEYSKYLSILIVIHPIIQVRIKCRDLVKKISIFKHRLAVQLAERIVVYELYNSGAADSKGNNTVWQIFFRA